MNRGAFSYFLIYLLTVLDVGFTSMGLKMNAIEEANPILNTFIKFSTLGTMIGVLLFVGVILLFLYNIKDRVQWLPSALRAVTVVKFFVVTLHLRWMALYLLGSLS